MSAAMFHVKPAAAEVTLAATRRAITKLRELGSVATRIKVPQAAYDDLKARADRAREDEWYPAYESPVVTVAVDQLFGIELVIDPELRPGEFEVRYGRLT